jgi:hypothetical protein
MSIEVSGSFREFGVGINNVLGIAVPGAILVSLTGAGVLPILSILANRRGESLPLPSTWGTATLVAGGLAFLCLSYLTGYILRLVSPDELDRLSAITRGGPSRSKVGFPSDFGQLKTWSEGLLARRHRLLSHLAWPAYWGRLRQAENVNPDKYPYRGFGDYVRPESIPAAQAWKQSLDNAVINLWKCDIQLVCPQLAARVEAEEAHIRLLSGTWQALRTGRVPIVVGLLSMASVTFDAMAPALIPIGLEHRQVWY